MFEGVTHHGMRCVEGSGTGHKEYARGMEHRVHAIPWTNCGDVRDCIRIAEKPPHRRVPHPIHHEPPNRPRGGAQPLPGELPHCNGGPERRRQLAEKSQE